MSGKNDDDGGGGGDENEDSEDEDFEFEDIKAHEKALEEDGNDDDDAGGMFDEGVVNGGEEKEKQHLLEARQTGEGLVLALEGLGGPAQVHICIRFPSTFLQLTWRGRQS